MRLYIDSCNPPCTAPIWRYRDPSHLSSGPYPQRRDELNACGPDLTFSHPSISTQLLDRLMTTDYLRCLSILAYATTLAAGDLPPKSRPKHRPQYSYQRRCRVPFKPYDAGSCRYATRQGDYDGYTASAYASTSTPGPPYVRAKPECCSLRLGSHWREHVWNLIGLRTGSGTDHEPEPSQECRW